MQQLRRLTAIIEREDDVVGGLTLFFETADPSEVDRCISNGRE